MMFTKLSLAALAASYSIVCNAAILTLYSDKNCQVPYTSVNVYDNSCATGVGGFQSYNITTAGGNLQTITTWSRDACAGPSTTCDSASSTNVCYPAFDSDGGSNAISSGLSCYLF
jgi:hypothetical protein